MRNNIEDIYSNISIDQYKTDIGFRTLVEGVNDYLYIIPEYQRKFKWKWEQVQELAVSLVRGLPIPPIYVWRNIRTGDLEILDGQQRVISLFLYYIGKFFCKENKSCFDYRLIDIDNYDNFESALSNTIPLKNITFTMEHNDKEYDISYSSLPAKIRKKVDYTTISIIEIKVSSDDGIEDAIHRIFANLNAGGTKLEPQEIRNGIFAGKFYNMLKGSNTHNSKWRSLYGNQIDNKEKDMECLLKLCAYKYYCKFENSKFNIEKYSGKLQKFLDEFSAISMEFDEQQVREYRTSIENFIDMFDFDKKIESLPVFEGIFVVMEKTSVSKKISLETYNAIKNRVLDTLDQGTAQRGKMIKRWGEIYEFLSKND